ncbi:uncharacterized protein BDR25DRAFT_245675 [Lindgomyces ingoldianus]|uniref:Uncharacterized protein n=1 Tax=Lindgomyces ingoldianus TaxID=673940 RepID=A0ACB6QA43_9PLEO|nr:uncharacterized protein BDR25DRAFT_245675 [Lindgomyces ingoldianus]KAF2463448.1 hypothetical protein BDR25DRAFT_245675 [Lindgomyces ingoldianus]
MVGCHTELQYLARLELYETEKPFLANFKVSNGARSTNHIFEPKPVFVEDGHGQPFSLDVNGFAFMKHETNLQPEDFSDADRVRSVYVDEINQFVRQKFPKYTDLVFLDFEVRRRDVSFLMDKLNKYPHAQPLRAAHVDMTTEGARLKINLLPEEQIAVLEGKDFERLLRGPTTDWPLAVLDYQSLYSGRDTACNDNIFVDAPSENFLLHYNEHHRWVYLKDQKPDEIYIF